MERRRILMLLGSIVLTLAVVIMSLVGACKAPAPVEPIKIGALMDMTSFHITDDGPTLEGIKLRLEEEGNQVDGRPIELIVRDYGSDPDMALDATKALVERDKVSLIIGPLDSGSVAAMADYLDRVQVPDLAQAMHGYEMALEHEWIWQTLGTLYMTTYAGGIYAAKELGYKTVTTLGIDYVAGHRFIDGFVMGFEEYGGKVIQQQWFPPNAVDFTPYLVALEKADVVTICAFGPTAIGVYTGAVELGIDMPIFDVYQEIDVPEKMEALGTSPIGHFGITPWTRTDEEPNKASVEFIAAFDAKYGYEPPSFAAIGYNAGSILIEALELAQGDYSSDNLARALNTVNIETIFGPQSFGDYRLGRINVLTTKVVPHEELFKTIVLKRYIVEGYQDGDKIMPRIVREY